MEGERENGAITDIVHAEGAGREDGAGARGWEHCDVTVGPVVVDGLGRGRMEQTKSGPTGLGLVGTSHHNSWAVHMVHWRGDHDDGNVLSS